MCKAIGSFWEVTLKFKRGGSRPLKEIDVIYTRVVEPKFFSSQS